MDGYPAHGDLTAPTRARKRPGDFYVDRDVCLHCCLPHTEAPELLNDPDVPFRECYFRRQPANDDEVEHALRAISMSCIDALHYAGNDPKILARLAELNRPNARAAWGCSKRVVPKRRSWWRRLFGGAG